jgi:hypothetical protein
MTQYFKSEEGVKAYKDIALKYPRTVWDENYDKFYKQTRESPDEINQTILLNVTRVQSPFVNEKHNKDIYTKQF